MGLLEFWKFEEVRRKNDLILQDVFDKISYERK